MSHRNFERLLHLFGRDLTLSDTKSLASSILPDDGVSEIFVHASSQGIGLVYKDDNRWLAWTFVDDHPAIQRGKDGHIQSSWAELVAINLGLLTFLADPAFPSLAGSSSSLTRDRILVIRSNNKDVKNAFKRRPWRYHLDPVVTDILNKAKDNGLKLKVKRVGPNENPAGGPSWGDYPPQELMLGWEPEKEDIEKAGLEGVLKVAGMALETSTFLSFQSSILGDGVINREEIYVDASTTGIGLVYKNDKRWLAWTYVEGHSAIQKGANGKIDACWGELVAAELALLTFLADPSFDSRNIPSGSSSSLPQKRMLVVKSDNRGVVKAIRRNSWNTRLDSILGRILTRAEENDVELKAKWLWTRLNPADGPSRGKYPPKEQMLEWAPPEVEVEQMGLRRVR